jgi:LemA protein
MKKSTLITVGIIALVVILFILVPIGQYNRLVSLRADVKNAFAQVDNQLQRRNDLIPNYVNTVKGYASHEKQVFTAIADARARLAGAATMSEKVQADQGLTSALSRLLVVVENYPNLKADQNFRSLQDELAGTENRIAVERMRYNDSATAYLKAIQFFPGNIIAGLFRFEPVELYKVAEEAKKVPEVRF